MSTRDTAKEPGTALVKYETDNGEVALSPQIIREYLVSGQGRVTDQEIMLFLRMCQYQRLNPFLREAYLIKYGDNQPATMVTGKEVFTKRAARHEACGGWEAGVLVLDASGALVERSGAMALDSEKLVGGWAKIHRKDRTVPTYLTVAFSEYAKSNKQGELQRNWREMPATMIRKVALVQALREAFPEQLQGLYSEEEEAPITERPQAARINAVEVVGASSAPVESEPAEAPKDRPELITDQQRRAMFAIARQRSLDEDKLDAIILKRYSPQSKTELTKQQASDLIDYLQALGAEAGAGPIFGGRRA